MVVPIILCKIVYMSFLCPDELHHFIEQHPHFVKDGIDFKDKPHNFHISQPKSCNGQNHKKDD